MAKVSRILVIKPILSALQLRFVLDKGLWDLEIVLERGLEGFIVEWVRGIHDLDSRWALQGSRGINDFACSREETVCHV